MPDNKKLISDRDLSPEFIRAMVGGELEGIRKIEIVIEANMPMIVKVEKYAFGGTGIVEQLFEIVKNNKLTPKVEDA